MAGAGVAWVGAGLLDGVAAGLLGAGLAAGLIAGGVGADAQSFTQGGCVGAGEVVEDRVVLADFGVQRLVALRERP